MKIKSGVVLMLLALSSGVDALGFKNISVASYLNEPLDARIPLVSISVAETDQLKVGLAGSDAFEKAGLVLPPVLTKLRFDVASDNQGAPYIHVTTGQGVREPFLNFLLEVTWQGTKLLREYTVLLDPRTAPVTPVRRAVPAAAAPTPALAERDSKTVGSAASAAAPREYGPVKRSETLWVIAQRVRPNRSVSVEQTMMALLDANPQAFRHGNVNFLKAGAMLTVPTEAQILRRSARQARQDFAGQNRDWKELRRGGRPQPEPRVAKAPEPAPVVTDGTQPPDAPDTTSDEPLASDAGANLRVVETEPEGKVPPETEAEALTEPVSQAQLRREIADSNRDLETVREINRDLVELKDALELKIEALRQALEARNRTIDRLEQRLNETLQRPDGQELKSRATRELLGGEQRVPGGVRSDIEMGRGKTEKPAPKPESAEVGKQPQSLQEKWLGLAQKYWLELAVAGGLLLLLFIVMLARKRKADSRVPDPDSFGSYIEDDDQPVTQASPLVTDESKGEARRPVVAQEPEETEGGFVPGEPTDVASALTEADIYLAYRRYGQAESLIQQAIESNPENMILKAKLLEIYAFRKDKSRFAAVMEAAYPAMTARSPEIWAKIVDMAREIVPDHELVAGGTLPNNSNDDLDNAFSLDLDVARGQRGDLPPGGGDRER